MMPVDWDQFEAVTPSSKVDWGEFEPVTVDMVAPPTDALERAARTFQLAGRSSAPVNAGAEPYTTAGGTKIIPPIGLGLPSIKTGPQVSLPLKVGAGAYNVGAGALNFTLSPEGLATALAPEVFGARFAAPALKGLFMGLMAKEAARLAGEASVTHDPQTITEAGLTGVSVPAIGGDLGLRKPPVQGPLATGAVLEPRPGAIVPRGEPAEPLALAIPEQIAAREAFGQTKKGASDAIQKPSPEAIPLGQTPRDRQAVVEGVPAPDKPAGTQGGKAPVQDQAPAIDFQPEVPMLGVWPETAWEADALRKTPIETRMLMAKFAGLKRPDGTLRTGPADSIGLCDEAFS